MEFHYCTKSIFWNNFTGCVFEVMYVWMWKMKLHKTANKKKRKHQTFKPWCGQRIFYSINNWKSTHVNRCLKKSNSILGNNQVLEDNKIYFQRKNSPTPYCCPILPPIVIIWTNLNLHYLSMLPTTCVANRCFRRRFLKIFLNIYSYVIIWLQSDPIQSLGISNKLEFTLSEDSFTQFQLGQYNFEEKILKKFLNRLTLHPGIMVLTNLNQHYLSKFEHKLQLFRPIVLGEDVFWKISTNFHKFLVITPWKRAWAFILQI